MLSIDPLVHVFSILLQLKGLALTGQTSSLRADYETNNQLG